MREAKGAIKLAQHYEIANCTALLLLLLLLLLVVKAMPRHAVTAVCMISSIVCPQLDV